MSIRVLLIEDDDGIADFVVRGLREEGFSVERKADADGGWEALCISSWDVILLDWWLPGRDGLSLLKQYRQAGHMSPVLFLTARDAVSDRVRGLDSGADDYLCKPFAFEELLARVRAMARRPLSSPGMELSALGIHVDLVTHQAERLGQRLDLTAKEESLLVMFLRNPGKILSRTRIYEQVWDDRYDGLSNTLEVHIGGLRKKLEAHGSRVIQTLRGRGYVFSETQHP